MGHTINVHREVYRLHHKALEVSKISRLLLAIEQGQVSMWKGKSLQEIGVSGKLM